MGDLREPNGVVWRANSSVVPSSSSLVPSQEVLVRAEQVTQGIIRQVQPTLVSEERRRDVIDYVQRLLKGCLGCEVFSFGSVPLKTYLPDGDIDLTAFCAFNFEEGCANDVYSVLEGEDHNPAAKFVVKDVQSIHAEVKLVKCLVQNIVVDISFNQIGGLCALCFLEEVDRLIGKDHLFKRSIILIKAWCYYESRILGAHHGLISTYALETLVLYIFHLFHSSLSGPLGVLFKFLDYFSKFDWENYCVSLSGPVPISSLPEIVAERPENGGGDFLLSDDFMRECVKKFSVPSRVNETNYRTFIQKHLNIVDPLKENNNLGRSVSKGNFYRIRSAFSFGARRLGQSLFQPRESIAEEICSFFTNTLHRHGKGQRPDVQDLSMPGYNGLSPPILVSRTEPCLEQRDAHEKSRNSNEEVVELGMSKDEVSASGSRLSRDSNDLTTSGTRDLVIIIPGDTSSPSISAERKSPLNNVPHAPHLYFACPLENGKMENGDLDERPTDSSSSASTGHKDSSLTSSERENNHLYNNSDLLASHDSNHHCSSVVADARLLPDLSGEVDSHLYNLQYGRWWYDYAVTMSFQQIHHSPPPTFPRKNHWDGFHQSVHIGRNMTPHVNVNGIAPRPAFFAMSPPVVSGSPFGLDERPRTRGTGMYFPNTNYQLYKDRSSTAKGRSHGQLKSPRANGRVQMPLDRSAQAQSPVRQGFGQLRSSDSHESSPRGEVLKEANGFAHSSHKAAEFGAVGHRPLEARSPETESSGRPDSSSSGSQNRETAFVVHDDRLGVESYRLKDDGDFPPLSC